MNCREIRDLLPLYADGDLGNGEQKAVAEHLALCAECARRLEVDCTLAALLTDLTPPERLAEMERSLRERVMAEVRRERRWQPLWRMAERVGNVTAWATVATVAALLVLALAVSWRPMMQRLGRATPTPGVPAPRFGPARDLIDLPPDVGLGQWAISPDGRWVACIALKEGAGDDSRPYQAVAMNLQSGQMVTLVPDLTEGGPGAQISWFPDSRRVLLLVPAEPGLRARLLVKGLDDAPATALVTADEVYGLGEAVPSPDGELVAFTCLHPADPAPVPRIGVEVVAVDGSGRRQIVEPDHFIGQLAWTPDGREIVYFKGKGGTPPDDGDAYAVSIDGGEPRLLLSQRRLAGWSPDGMRALWLREPAERNGSTELTVSSWPLAGGPRLLAEGVDAAGVAWVGDRWVAYAQRGVLFLGAVDGGVSPLRLSPEGEWAAAPVWLPGKGLAYAAERPEQRAGVTLRLLPLVEVEEQPTAVPTQTPVPTRAPGLEAIATSERGPAGALVGRILITNTGSMPVTLQGSPIVAIVDGAGNELPTLRGEWQDPNSVPDRPVTLEPGGQAQARFTWANYCGAAPPGPLTFRLRLPAGDWLDAPVLDASGKPVAELPRCNTEAPASALTMDPFEPAEPVSAPTPQSGATAMVSIMSLEMEDSSAGWAVSERRILRTADGARTWQDVTPDGARAAGTWVVGSAFEGASAWVACWDQPSGRLSVWSTADGGETWQRSELPAAGMGVNLCFIDGGRGWALVHQGVAAGSEGVTLLSSADGGRTWREVAHSDPQNPAAGGLPFGGLKQGITFADERTGWLVASEPVPGKVPLYVTRDGGRTWREQSLELPEGWEGAEGVPSAPIFFGPMEGALPVRVAGERNGIVLYRTRDGGQTWSVLDWPSDGWTQKAVAVLSVDEVWVLGEGADGGIPVLYHTRDGGRTWRGLKADLPARDARHIEFAGERGWALADGGVFRTDDGGQMWTRLDPVVSLPALPGETATHTDTQIGYALDYPAEWYIRAEPGWTVILTSFDASGPGIGGLRPGQAKVDLLPDKAWHSRSLEQMVSEVGSGDGVLWEERWTLSGGVPAVRLQVRSEVAGEAALLCVVINGQSLSLQGYGDLVLFDAIAASLRPVGDS